MTGLETTTEVAALPAPAEVGRIALGKASRRLLPLLAVGYGIAYMDRANVSFAALQMNHDLHFSASVYGFGAGIFFIGYALFEIPSNLLLVRFGARRWLARIMFTWGLLAMAMLLVRTPLQFYAMRFLLGMAEAGFFPGVIFYLTQWFPAQQRARSISQFYIAFPLSSALMGAIAGALLSLQGRLGLAGWQWLFLVEGVPAVLISIVLLLRLPDSPADARWLSHEERQWIVSTIAQEQAAAGPHDDSWRALLRDSRFWLMCLFFFSILFSAYSYIMPAPLILQQLTGLTPGKVGFLISGAYLLAAGAMIQLARHSDRTRERYLHIAAPFLLVAVCFMASGLSTSAWVGVPALTLLVIGYGSTLGVQWTIPPLFLRGRTAAGGIAALNSIGILGGFVGPYWMGVARDLTGTYQRGLLTCTIPSLLVVGIMMWMRRNATTLKPLSPDA